MTGCHPANASTALAASSSDQKQSGDPVEVVKNAVGVGTHKRILSARVGLDSTSCSRNVQRTGVAWAASPVASRHRRRESTSTVLVGSSAVLVRGRTGPFFKKAKVSSERRAALVLETAVPLAASCRRCAKQSPRLDALGRSLWHRPLVRSSRRWVVAFRTTC